MRLFLAGVLLAVAAIGQAHAAQTEEATLKRIATEYYNATLNEKDFDKASRYLAPNYIQHSPTAADGAAGLKQAITDLKQKFPGFRADIKRSFVDGKYVIFHAHVTMGPEDKTGMVLIDIVRFDDDNKVAEHWDLAAPLPKTSENPYPPV